MWLYRITFHHFYWSLAVLKKFFKLVPLPTLLLVFLTLVSQFSRMLAFFMPLKVIILLGSTGTPGYFPDSWAALDRDVLVLGLSLATAFFYAISLSSEKLMNFTADRGAAGVVEGTNKLVLFTNQDEVASQAYKRLAAGLATGALAVLLGLLFAIIYPGFLLAALSYFLLASAFVALLGKNIEVRSELQQKAGAFSGLLSGVGFMLLFAFMVIDFLLWEGVSFMVAIISLLLSRQLLNRLDGVIKDAIWLSDKRLQINAIFFTGHKLERGADSHRKRKLWKLLSLNETPEKLFPLLERVHGSSLPVDSTVACRWRQSGLMDIIVFLVELELPGSESRCFLLKVFGSQHKKAALNEADLLFSDTGRELPAAPLVAVDQIEGYDAHIFRLSANPGGASLHQTERFSRCWQMEPGKELITRYSRSHPFLHQRLSASMLSRLAEVATAVATRAHVEELRLRFDEILAELGKLPLAVLNSGIPPELSFSSEKGELQLAHWGSWSLEPVGANFPLGKALREQLDKALESAAESRDALKEIPTDRIRLCVCLSHFEMRFNRQKYFDAIALIPEMLGYLNKLDSISGADQSAVSGSVDNTAEGTVDS